MARDYTAKVAREAVAFLEPGENVHKAVMGNPEGSLLAELNRGRGTGRAAYRAVEAKRAAEEATGTASTIPRRNSYVAVTDSRIVIFGVTSMGKLESILAAFPFDQVRGVTSERVGATRRNSMLRIGFIDQTSVTFQVIQNQSTEELADAFRLRR